MVLFTFVCVNDLRYEDCLYLNAVQVLRANRGRNTIVDGISGIKSLPRTRSIGTRRLTDYQV